jgi:hypothetical protein
LRKENKGKPITRDPIVIRDRQGDIEGYTRGTGKGWVTVILNLKNY